MTAGLSATFSSPPASYLKPLPLSATSVIGMTWRYTRRFSLTEAVAFDLGSVVAKLPPALVAGKDDHSVKLVVAELPAEVIEAFGRCFLARLALFAVKTHSALGFPGEGFGLGELLLATQGFDGLVEDRLCVPFSGPSGEARNDQDAHRDNRDDVPTHELTSTGMGRKRKTDANPDVSSRHRHLISQRPRLGYSRTHRPELSLKSNPAQ